ncbi:hypothetical protein C0989_004197 [Termitomyces sp. Mn162]|nr:hypothetical protein C0989_004197 [Termitomyces sp. Mn162]
MPPRLRVLAGTGTKLAPITHLVNTTNAFSLVSDQFEGEIAVCIKDLTRQAKEDAHNYFERPERQGITWSIQVRGKCCICDPGSLVNFDYQAGSSNPSQRTMYFSATHSIDR